MAIAKQIISVTMICATVVIITAIWRSTIDTINSQDERIVKTAALVQTDYTSKRYRNKLINYCMQYPADEHVNESSWDDDPPF